MAQLKQYPIAGGNAIIQTPIVDIKTGMLHWQWLKWFQDVQARVQTAITPAGIVAPDASGGETFARQSVSLGEGTLAPQTNMTTVPVAVPGANADSLFVANFAGPASAQPFFIALSCWWNADVNLLNIEISNCSTTVPWIYDGMSISVGVLV